MTMEYQWDDLWVRAYQHNDNNLLSAIIVLEGLWLKLCQYVSSHENVPPNSYIQLLTQLQEHVPSRPLLEVTAINFIKCLIFLYEESWFNFLYEESWFF